MKKSKFIPTLRSGHKRGGRDSAPKRQDKKEPRASARVGSIILILCIIIIIETGLLINLWIMRPKKVLRPPLFKGKIAIVLDDWGYNQNNLYIATQIKYPLTISVLPNLNYSSSTAGQLRALGYEIILHLPMEPFEKYRLEKDTLLSSMPEAKIISIINRDLKSVGYAVGVSNHMGSRLTADLGAMRIIFQELKKRHLYFLDSLVSSGSVGAMLAKQMNLKFAKRDIFLDNKEEPAYIKTQLYKLKIKARLYGKAIGIGHDRKVTLEVLRETMPELEKEGYKFVYVSELVR